MFQQVFWGSHPGSGENQFALSCDHATTLRCGIGILGYESEENHVDRWQSGAVIDDRLETYPTGLIPQHFQLGNPGDSIVAPDTHQLQFDEAPLGKRDLHDGPVIGGVWQAWCGRDDSYGDGNSR